MATKWVSEYYLVRSWWCLEFSTPKQQWTCFVLHITENEISLWKHQKIWAVIWGDVIFLLFKVSLADLADVDILSRDSLSRNVVFSAYAEIIIFPMYVATIDVAIHHVRWERPLSRNPFMMTRGNNERHRWVRNCLCFHFTQSAFYISFCSS